VSSAEDPPVTIARERDSEGWQARERFTSQVSRARDKALWKHICPDLDTEAIEAAVGHMADAFAERLRTGP